MAEYKLDILEISDNFDISVQEKKICYNTDDLNTANKWVKEGVDGEYVDLPSMSSALTLTDKNKRMLVTSLGYFVCDTNNVYGVTNGTGLMSRRLSNNFGGVDITKENFYKVVTLFTARKSIKTDWVNWYDGFIEPNINTDSFNDFYYDSIVYSLFNSKSGQSSLRDYNIKNEFFWLSADRMKELADENGYDELWKDSNAASDRHVYKLLFGEERIYDKLSDDAKAVLDKATELVERSMELRQVMANDENHLNSWDAGYAQLKLVWKEYFQEDFTEFRRLYKIMEDRMRPLVYELGFLMK